MDGSGFKGNIGTAAIVPQSGQSLCYKLGKESKHTVFEREVVGILLALQLLDTCPAVRSALIALNIHAVIHALQENRTQPTQCLLDKIHATVSLLKRKPNHLHIHLEWIPGHMDIAGNDLVDEHAKRAATGEVSNANDLPDILEKRLPAGVSVLKAKRKKTILQRWKKL